MQTSYRAPNLNRPFSHDNFEDLEEQFSPDSKFCFLKISYNWYFNFSKTGQKVNSTKFGMLKFVTILIITTNLGQNSERTVQSRSNVSHVFSKSHSIIFPFKIVLLWNCMWFELLLGDPNQNLKLLLCLKCIFDLQ